MFGVAAVCIDRRDCRVQSPSVFPYDVEGGYRPPSSQGVGVNDDSSPSRAILANPAQHFGGIIKIIDFCLQ